MKKLLLSSVAFALTLAANGQNNLQTSPTHLRQAKLMSKHMEDVAHVNLQVSTSTYSSSNQSSKLHQNGVYEEVIGETYYDLQTNSAVQNRLFVHDDNSVSAVWTMSPDENSGFPNRGTGYNHYDGSAWLDFPSSRIEEKRTGWPSIAGINGGEIVASHVFGDPSYHTTLTSRTTVGSGDWEENLLPNSDSAYDNVWPRMKVGGADGQSIHLISNTYSLDNNYITYSRSTDAGATWDIIDSILPGTGPDYYMGFGGDSYALDVKGETIAFVLGDSWTDVILMKSTDNGSTWTKTIIREHPLPMFNDDVIVDSVSFPDTGGAIENSDQSFSISLDSEGNAHIFYGLMEYSNDVLDDDSWSYYPATDGLVYWNESTNEELLIASVLDVNGNDTIDIQSGDNISKYYKSLTSFPNSVIAENGDIYLTYSGVIEFLYDIQIEIGDDGIENFLQHYRHQYIMRSQDGGETWSDPYDLMAEITDPELGDPLLEGVFGAISNIVGDYVYITYQRDYLAGLNVRGDEDPITENSIVFVQIPIAGFESLSTEELSVENLDFTIYPNPSSDIINIHLAHNKGEAKLNVVNVLGETLMSNTQTGTELILSIESLPKGIYWISIETPKNRLVKSFVKN